MSWNTISPKVNIPLQAWEDIRQYSVSYRSSEQTRYRTTLDDIRYDFALSAAATADGMLALEFLKYNLTLNNQPFYAIPDQVAVAMQAAIYPYVIMIGDEAGHMNGIGNFTDIRKAWDKEKAVISAVCNGNADVMHVVERMEPYLAGENVFYATIKKDILFQSFFLPLYNKSFYVDGLHTAIDLELHNDILGAYRIDGKLTVASVDEDACTLRINAEKRLQHPEDIAAVRKALAHHYDLNLVQDIYPVIKIAIEQQVNRATGRVDRCHAVFEIEAGAYLSQKEELSIDYLGSIAPEAGEERYKTAYLKQNKDIIF